MKQIVSTEEVTFTNKEGKTFNLVKVNRIDTKTGFPCSDTVEKDSIFDPTSKNYNAELDRE